MHIDITPPCFITADDIFQKKSESEIYKFYCPEFPAKSIKSPFRKDKHPSFGFFKSGNKWLWKDYAYGDGGDVFDFVGLMEGISGFTEILHRINDRFVLDLGSPFKFDKTTIGSARKQYEIGTKVVRTPIYVKPKPYGDYDIAFWSQWPITLSILNAYSVKTAQAAWMGEWITHHPFAVSTETNPLFYFHFEKTHHVKIYQPYAKDKKDKFRSNCDNLTDVQGYDQCQIKKYRGRPLILTKALKECMFYRAFGINAMALHGEGSRIYPGFIRHLRKYCGPIISVYDNDPAGVLGAMHLSKNYMIPKMFTCQAKNVTDLWLVDQHAVFHFINKLYDEFDRIQSAGVYSEYTRELSLQSITEAY